MLALPPLRAVLAVSETGSFRRAAERLQVSPPSLTRLVGQAEKEAGFRIFERSASGVALTGEGRGYVLQCAEFLKAVSAFEGAVESIRSGEAGAITIGCGPLTTHSIVYPMVEALLERWPDLGVTVKVHADIQPVHELRERALDLFIGDLTHTTAFDDLDVVKLRRKPITVVAHPDHPIHELTPCSLATLTRYPLALPFLHRYWKKTFELALQAQPQTDSFRPARFQQITCDDFDLLVRFAESGKFVCGGSPESFADSLAAGRLREVPMEQPVYWNICCAQLSSPATPQQAFAWQYLVEGWGG